MSSQDKTGPRDGTEDAAPEDRPQDTATELSENGAADPEIPDIAPENGGTRAEDGIEDAEFADDAMSAGDDVPDDTMTDLDGDASDSPEGTDDEPVAAAEDDGDQAAQIDSDTADDTADVVAGTGDAETDIVEAGMDDADPASDDSTNLTGAAPAAALAGTAAAASMAATGTDTDPARPASPTPEAPANAAPQKSGGGFVPALLGGVIAAGIGFGTAVYMGGDILGGDDGVERALAAQGDSLAALDERLGELADAMAAPPDNGVDALGDRMVDRLGEVTARIETLAGSVNAVQGDVASLQDRFDGLDAGLSDLAGRLGSVERQPMAEGSEDAQAAVAAYEEDLQELRTALEEQTEVNATLAAQLEERTAAAQAEIDAAAARAEELQAQAEEQARIATEQAEEQARLATEQADARAAVAALREALASLDSALEKGAPFADPLAVLSEKGEVPQALTDAAADGVASLPDLRAAFPDLARDALDASIRETVGDDVTGRAYAFLRAQTGLRSLEPRDGDDPDAVLSRAEAALREGDLATTLSELEQLPPTGQDVLSDWMARAEQRRAVTEAATTLADTLLAN